MSNSTPPKFDAKGKGGSPFGSKRGRLLYLAGAASIATVVGYASCTSYVRPNEVAIKQVTLGVGKGIKPDIYQPGLRFVSVGTERFHRFPSDIQVLDLTNDSVERSAIGDDRRRTPALNIQTSEGYSVTVDISVLYRIEDPYKVITQVGPGRLYEDALIVPRSEQILRKRLGELEAEEFYDAGKREQKVTLALRDLSETLKPSGISVLQVFVRNYVYDERYQNAIEQRKIQDQMVFKNQAEGDMAMANAEKEKIVAQGDALVRVELARGEAERRKMEAEAELYARKKRAAADLEVQLAEAEGTRLENEALRGVGSDNMVGLKMAEVLRGTRMIVIPTDAEGGFNPLDVRSALKHMDVRE